MKESKKTHWLKNPNKNYLGHWDLPIRKDLILTIKSANWEDVENPVNRTKEIKRVVRFIEDYKPLICNQTNAGSIYKSTGIPYMEDVAGSKIALYIADYYDRKEKETISAIRIRNESLKPLKKESLTKEHKRFKDGVKAVKDGKIQPDAALEFLKKTFDLSEDVEKAFINSI